MSSSSDTEPFENPLERCPKQAMNYQDDRFSEYNLRQIWAEVELNIYGQLRFGEHPKDVEKELNRVFEENKDNNEEDYRILMRFTMQRVLDNLAYHGMFEELPHIEVYKKLTEDPVRKSRWNVMMYQRFEDLQAFQRSAMDPNKERDMAGDPPLDEEYLEILRDIKEEIMDDVEAHHIDETLFLEEEANIGWWEIRLEDPFVGGEYPRPRPIPSNQPNQGRPSTRAHPTQPTDATTWQANEAGPRRPLGELIPVPSAKIGSRSAPTKLKFSLTYPSGNIPRTIISQKNYPHTPRNKHHEPKITFGDPGLAFYDRPVSLGSPEISQRCRQQASSNTSGYGTEAVRLEPVGLSLDAVCDAFEKEPERPSAETPDPDAFRGMMEQESEASAETPDLDAQLYTPVVEKESKRPVVELPDLDALFIVLQRDYERFAAGMPGRAVEYHVEETEEVKEAFDVVDKFAIVARALFKKARADGKAAGDEQDGEDGVMGNDSIEGEPDDVYLG